MAHLPGGAAARLGFRYEDWWTLLRVADLLRGTAVRLRTEPPGIAGVGIEFWVDEADGSRWCEQVKDAADTWTIHRLKTKGVLAAFAGHLAAGYRARLVSSTAATPLASLADRARIAADIAELHEIATKPEWEAFEQLTRTWNVTKEVALDWLSRTHVEHEPSAGLRRSVHFVYERLVQGDSELTVNELRGWLDDMLHQTITAPQVWAHLESKGFSRRLLAGDPAALDALAATISRHRRRIDGACPAEGLVASPHANALQKQLTGPASEQVVVVHGRAGSGKSTVVREVLQTLAAEGWFAAVVGMDAIEVGTRSASRLGRASELDGSPAVLLDGVAAGSPAVLVVDQLDAVSTYSGRMPESFDAVAEVLEQAIPVRNLKVVLVVRSVDLHNDQRLRHLLDDRGRVSQFEVGDLTTENVRAGLNAAGVDVASLTHRTIELLRSPLHYSVFSRLSSASQHDEFRSVSELFERRTTEVREAVAREIGGLDWATITSTLVDYMTTHERLAAPKHVLDLVPPQQVSALLSHGLLIAVDSKIMFFHETYFDYVFALAFVNSGRDLHEFLVTSGQHLFRRAQTRQVLAFLADHDRDRFRRDVGVLLASESLRPHLREVVVTVLRNLEATAEDWQTIELLAFPAGQPCRHDLVALLSKPCWFDAADGAGRWEVLLSDASTANDTANQLIAAPQERAGRVAELVRPFAGTSDAWRARLRSLVAWSLHPELVDLAVELIHNGDLDDLTAPIAGNADFWMLLHSLAEDDAGAAARMIGVYLRRCLDRATADGIDDPFRSEFLRTHSPGGGSLIAQVAASAPTAFVREVLPFIVDVADRAAVARSPGNLRTTFRWGWYHREPALGVDAALFAGVESSLRSTAQPDPHLVPTEVWDMARSDVRELRFLACRFLAATHCGDKAIEWLLSDRRNLDLPTWSSRDLIRTATRYATDGAVETLTSALLAYFPARETTTDERRQRGRAQLELLAGVEPMRRTSEVQRRLAELERKFAGSPITEPRGIEFHDVVAPIAAAAAPLLTDDDWLRAVRKHPDNRVDWRANGPVGGAASLATQLRVRADEEPERFARLALRFDSTTPPVHLCRVLDSVGGRIPASLLAELGRHARATAGQAVSHSLCRSINATAASVDDDLVALLEDCATDTDPDHDADHSSAWSGGSFSEGALTVDALNCTRGMVGHTCARLLALQPRYAGRLTPLVSALAADPILAVRVGAAAAITELIQSVPETALLIAHDLFAESVPDIFDADPTMRLLRTAMLRDPNTFALHLNRALAGPDPVAQRAGSVWAVSFVNGCVVEPLPTEIGILGTAARRGSTAVFASIPDIAIDQLVTLFDDDEPSVRETAAAAMRELNEVDPATTNKLLDAFVTSAGFADNFDGLFHSLARSTRPLPTSAIDACERATRAAGPDFGDLRTRRAATSDDVIAVVLRLYRQGDQETRGRCLDVIDELAQVHAYGLDTALEHER